MESDESLFAFWESLQNPIQLDKTYLLYIESLTVGLKSIVLAYFPHLKAQMHLFEDKMDESIYWAARRIYDETEDLIDEDDPDSEEYIPISYKTKSVIEQKQLEQLASILELFPPDEHDAIRKICSEDNDEEMLHEEFLFKCHGKAKEMLLKYFPEIPEMSGNTIRRIDNTTHSEMRHWIQSFYEYSDADSFPKSSEEAGLPSIHDGLSADGSAREVPE